MAFVTFLEPLFATLLAPLAPTATEDPKKPDTFLLPEDTSPFLLGTPRVDMVVLAAALAKEATARLPWTLFCVAKLAFIFSSLSPLGYPRLSFEPALVARSFSPLS